MSSSYLNRVSDEAILKMDPDEQKDFLGGLAQEQLRYVAEEVPFWQKRDVRSAANSVNTPDDLIPAVGGVLLKDHFRDGSYATMTSQSYTTLNETEMPETIAFLTYSGGTSSRTEGKLPTMHIYPVSSWETQIRTMRRAAGLTGDEKIVAKDNYTADHFGGKIFNAAIEGYGRVPENGLILPRHPILTNEQNVDLMRQNEANLLIATPSAEEGKAFQSIEDMLIADDIKDPYITSDNVHEVWFSSKPPEIELLEELHERGLYARGFFGSAEAGMLGRECYGSMRGDTDDVIYHAELGPTWMSFLESSSLERLAEPGEEAAIIISVLGSDGDEKIEPEKGRGLIAYFMGDEAMYLGHHYCEDCKITAPTFANPRRAQYMDEHIQSSCAVPV